MTQTPTSGPVPDDLVPAEAEPEAAATTDDEATAVPDAVTQDAPEEGTADDVKISSGGQNT